MTKKKRGRPPPANTGPANRTQRDRFRAASDAYAKRPKKHPESESEFNTSDEEKFRTDKLAMTLSEERIRCDQKTCTRYATHYVETNDPKDDDIHQELSTHASCTEHAHNTKKFNGFHIVNILDLEEGMAKEEAMMPSAKAMDMMEQENNVTISFTKRTISRRARRKAEAERITKTKATQEPPKAPEEYILAEHEREFPTLQPIKKIRIGVEGTPTPTPKKKPAQEVSGVVIPDSPPALSEMDNIPKELVSKGGLTKRLAYRAGKPNPETVSISDTTEYPEISDDEIAKPDKVTQPGNEGDIAGSEATQTDEEEEVTQTEVTQTETKTEEEAPRNTEKDEDLRAMDTEEAVDGEETMEIAEGDASDEESLVSTETDIPDQEEIATMKDEYRQKWIDGNITSEEFLFHSNQLENLSEQRIAWEARQLQETTQDMEEVEEEELPRPSMQAQPSKQKQKQSFVESIQKARANLEEAHQVSHQVLDAVADKLDAMEDRAAAEGIIVASTSQPLYSKMVAKTAEQKGKGKEKEDDSAESESENELESDLMARECKLVKPHSGLRTPPFSDQTNTLWWDLSKVTAEHKVIAKAILREKHIVGYQYRQRSQWLELGYERDAHRDEALSKIVNIDERNALSPIAPRHILGNEIFIQLVNVPMRLEGEIRNELTPVLQTFGRIKQLEPVKYKFSSLMTRRWNVLLCIPWGTKLVMPSILEIKGRRILAFWEGSLPACSTCLEGGHWQSQCTPALRNRAADKAYRKANPAPFNPPETDKQPTTPPTQPSSSSSSGSSPKSPPKPPTKPPTEPKPKSPPPPPPQSAKETPAAPKPKPNPNPAPDSPKTGQGKGKGVKAMQGYMEKYGSQIKGFAETVGFKLPTLEVSSEEENTGEKTQEKVSTPPSNGEFTEYKHKKTAIKEKIEQKKAELKQLQEAQTAKNVGEKEKELQRKRNEGKRKVPTPFNSPSRKQPPSKQTKIENPKAGRPRTKVEKGTYCYYAINTLGRSKEHVERVWNKNRVQWETFRATKINKDTYTRIYDWGRSPKGQATIFNPVEWGIKTYPSKPEDKIEEAEKTSTASSLSESDLDNTITVFVKIVNPETDNEEKVSLAVPIGASVNYLKRMIATKYSVELPDFQVISRGRVLRKEKMGLEIKDRFRLDILGNWEKQEEVKTPEPAFKVVFIKDPSISVGNRVAVNIDPATTTDDLIRSYARTTKKVARQLTLLFNDQILQPNETLVSAGVKNKDTILLSPELKYFLKVRAIIDGEIQVKTVGTTNETTLEVVKHDVETAFGSLPAEFELEKDEKILPSSEKVCKSLFDGAIVSLRFKGTTQWDSNKLEESGASSISAKPDNNDNFVTLNYHNGIRWVRESFSYRWTESTTFEAIRNYLREMIADDKLQIRYDEKDYEIKTTLKEANVELEERELYVEAVQDDTYMATVGETSAGPKTP